MNSEEQIKNILKNADAPDKILMLLLAELILQSNADIVLSANPT